MRISTLTRRGLRGEWHSFIKKGKSGGAVPWKKKTGTTTEGRGVGSQQERRILFLVLRRGGRGGVKNPTRRTRGRPESWARIEED